MTDTYAFLIREPAWDSDSFLPGPDGQPPTADLATDPTMAAHGAFEKAVEELGARVTGGAALQDAHHGGVTTPGPDGHEVEQAVHTDSPYADSSELITGFYLVEVADEEMARRVAAMVPTGGTVEWRKLFPMG